MKDRYKEAFARTKPNWGSHGCRFLYALTTVLLIAPYWPEHLSKFFVAVPVCVFWVLIPLGKKMEPFRFVSREEFKRRAP